MDGEHPIPLHVTTGDEHAVFDGDREVSVGRDPGCDVVMNDPRVSRRHLMLRPTSRGWEAEDTSTRGTYDDHVLLVARTPVRTGLRLRLGHPDDGPELLVGTSLATLRLQPATRPLPGSVVASQPMRPVIRVGRHPDNDLVIDDLSVSRQHAVVRQGGDGWWVEDLGSTAGTFIDGRPVSGAAPLRGGQRLALGRHVLVMDGGRLVDHVDDAVTLETRDLVVEVGGQRILDRVSFAAEAGQMVAVIGPTGAGKSTLIKAMSGYSRPTAGTVTYNGQDVHASLAQLRSRIGYVPQDDICHVQLRLGVALRYAAELRFGADTARDERRARVTEVLGELGLGHRAGLRIDKLSGGQRKRASIAMELLTRPALMFCDEPTSGLDPAYERSVTELLRGLADGGRTIVIVTHSVASLHLYDRVLCLAPGGRPAFYGPPGEALAYFGVADWPALFSLLEHEERDWTGELEQHPSGRQYVAGPLARRLHPLPQGPAPESRRGSAVLRQTWTLLRRSAVVAMASRTYVMLLLAQAPVIALILLAAVGTGQLDGFTLGVFTGNGNPGSKALLLLALLVVATVTIGLVNSCRELVKERTVWERERAVGLGVLPYLTAKFLLVTGIATVQVLVMCLIVVRPQRTGAGLVVDSGTVELGVVLLAVAVTSSALGLTISAVARQEAVALVAVPVVVIAQLVLCGAFVLVENEPGLEQAAWATTGYWGFNAAGSTARVLALDPVCARLQRGTASEAVSPIPCSARASHDPTVWTENMAGVLALLPLLLGVTWWVLARRRPD